MTKNKENYVPEQKGVSKHEGKYIVRGVFLESGKTAKALVHDMAQRKAAREMGFDMMPSECG